MISHGPRLAAFAIPLLSTAMRVATLFAGLIGIMPDPMIGRDDSGLQQDDVAGAGWVFKKLRFLMMVTLGGWLFLSEAI